MAVRSDLFKICRKIIGIGRNYRDHATELNNPVPTAPLLFLKPPSSLLAEGEAIKIPEGSTSLHHEVELGIVIGRDGSCIPEPDALNYVSGYVLALDMTARDYQNEAKKNGLPWVLAKCWDTFCPISDVILPGEIPDPHNIDLWLKVNEESRQNGNTKDMIFSIPHVISYASKIMKLQTGDLILTGTPSGVGPVNAGDVIECGLAGIKSMKFNVEKSVSTAL